MNNHYEQLGVKPDATEAEIKRAYRAKARDLHPDKGGDASEFAEVASAYEVLSDPHRRLLYDATGESVRTPIEQEVQQILLSLFNEALAGEDGQVVEFVRERVKIADQRLKDERKTLKALIKKLKAKRGKFKTSSTINLIHQIIDGEIKRAEGSLFNIDHAEEVQKALHTELATYEEDHAPAFQTFDLRRFGYESMTI